MLSRTYLARAVVGLPAAAVVLLGVATAAYGIFLLVVGQPWTTVAEGGSAPVTVFEPTPAGTVPVIAGLVLMLGVVLRRRPLAWTGATILTAFASLFVMGVGGALLPVAFLSVLGLLALR